MGAGDVAMVLPYCRSGATRPHAIEGMNTLSPSRMENSAACLLFGTLPSFVRYGGLVHLGKGASRAAGYSGNACRWGSTGRAPCQGSVRSKAWGFRREYVGVAERVDDPADPRLSEYVDLRDPDLRRRVEPDGGFFVAESPHVIRTVIGAGRRVRSVLVTPVQHDALASALATIDAPVYVAEPRCCAASSGSICIAARSHPSTGGRSRACPTFARRRAGVAVLERVNDHENLGVLFRNAAAFGLDAVVLDAECSDPLYRRTVRVSIGHVCTVPWARYASLDEVRGAGLALVALTPGPDAAAIDDIEWPDRCALMLGAEGPGLSDAALARADLAVRIPMRSDVDSLNVATAAAIVFHVSRSIPRSFSLRVDGRRRRHLRRGAREDVRRGTGARRARSRGAFG